MDSPMPGTENLDISAPRSDANGSGAEDSSSSAVSLPPPPPPSPSPSVPAQTSPAQPSSRNDGPVEDAAPSPQSAESYSQQQLPQQPGGGSGGGSGGQAPQYGNQPNQRQQQFGQGGQRPGGDRDPRNNGRRNQRNPRGRGRNARPPQQREQAPRQPLAPIIPDGETTGWYDPQREGGFVRRAANSYLTDPGDAYLPPNLARQYGLRRGDAVLATTGRDHRGRVVVAEIIQINGDDPTLALRRPDFGSLIASYPERKLTLETGRPAKGGPELTRRAIDLIAPIGYGQRALIVAPARAGKTMLLQAIVEGVAINHPQAVLLVLLVDERPEEVSEMITWGYGEVVASSFDMPAVRHTDVTEMVLERARRLVELGRDVVIVLDSITRMARAYNTVERGTGRTLSGGLDATAMARPKAFFGSARSVAPEHGGGSLTIISTALVETGSRMDDVIFEEFKGTGNCEIKLDRSLAEKRIFPAIDVSTSGTRREDKLFPPHQLEHV
jgi:transcription termination factor Rho